MQPNVAVGKAAIANGRRRRYNPVMERITLENYRCFREEQSARLAPLTLLVGENSTGKTSFLALIRALWDTAFTDLAPDFQEPPYNLGSFRDIVHSRGGRSKPAKSFAAGFADSAAGKDPFSFHTTFEERAANPFPVIRRLDGAGGWIEAKDLGSGKHQFKGGETGGKEYPLADVELPTARDKAALTPLFWLMSKYSDGIDHERDAGQFNALFSKLVSSHYGWFRLERPFASSPVRSRPRRTYDPSRPLSDPEGENTPTYLASFYHRNSDEWQILKGQLEKFGKSSGLFDEIGINAFGKVEGTPFQLQLRKFADKGRRKGPARNLIDVGYGVSQALPLLTALLRAEGPELFLLQQPEVHLHPKAQAALGSLFCDLAAQGRQLIVETHSDYLVDRITMDVRDKATQLKPEDVSILYFEPGDLSVQIHSIRLDEMGNVLGAPPSYGQFFMAEVSRSIGIGR